VLLVSDLRFGMGLSFFELFLGLIYNSPVLNWALEVFVMDLASWISGSLHHKGTAANITSIMHMEQ